MSATPRFRTVATLAIAWWLIGLGINIDISAEAPVDSGGPEPIVITVRSKATVSARGVTIGDVAELTGGNALLRERAAVLDLSEIGVDDVVTVKKRQVDIRLRLADFPTRLFRIEGSTACSVTAKRLTVTEDSILEAAKKAAFQRLPWPPNELSITLVQPITAPLPSATSSQEISIKAEPHSTSISPGGAQIDVTVFVCGEKKMSLPVYLEIKVLQQVSLARAVARGEILLEENVLTDRRATGAGAKILAPEMIIGRRLKRAVAAGTMIQPADLEDSEAGGKVQSAVRAKQMVKMVVRLGAVNVVANGEALQEGKIGDRVRVQNLDSKKVVVGKVTGPGTVDVE